MQSVADVPLAIFTTIIGAILGAVLTPLGDTLCRKFIFKAKKKNRDFHSAFLLFFIANAIWIMGEIFVEIFVRSLDKVDWWTAAGIAFVFSLAAFTFVVGFQYLPRGTTRGSTSGALAPAVRLLIIGNILWITGEVFETFFSLLLSEKLASIARMLFSVIALVYFIYGARAAHGRIPTSAESS